jgi:tetraacyldisaccharide-1-P 4'-kinase
MDYAVLADEESASAGKPVISVAALVAGQEGKTP